MIRSFYYSVFNNERRSFVFAIIGSALFLVIVFMTVLVAYGFPLGEFTMGVQYKVLPKKYVL